MRVGHGICIRYMHLNEFCFWMSIFKYHRDIVRELLYLFFFSIYDVSCWLFFSFFCEE